jgi:Trp operon repressor
MPHVSIKKLDPKFLEKLFGKLLSILEQAQNSNHLFPVVNELLTSTEKVMLAKRLAIILMLDSHIPQNRIVEILKVSPTTVAKMSLEIEIGKYEIILKTSKKEKIDLEKIVWNILTVGGIMPPKIGRKYWTKYYKK